jgi:hypothetical protein
VLDQGGAGFGAVAVDHVYYAWGEAGLGDQLGEDEGAEGRLLGGFENDGVAAGQRWAEPRIVSRQLPDSFSLSKCVNPRRSTYFQAAILKG